MNKAALKEHIKDKKCPRWPCPTCGKETLEILENTLCIKETRQSRIDRQHEDFENEFTETVYSCILKCTSCSEYIATSGDGYVDEDYITDSEGEYIPIYVDVLVPKYFSPGLILFNIPEKTPNEVKASLEKSFQLYFSNKSAAANQLRISIELLLDKLKVRKTINQNGKRKNISLHKRIENMPAKFSDIKKYLFAVKWIGNYGSHEKNELNINDLLDGYEITEKVLFSLYDNRDKTFEKKVKQINKKKGPLSS